FEMTLREGRNRQIKRMMEHYGLKVTRLHRRNIEFLYIRDLKPGEYRRLKPYEVEQLRVLALSGKK
ncbi:MAG: pseudouridine synthase, partial [Erysipelotrichaceae bacterium]|nr:pseudouridine synthase [Erysipelotrichaceae bacterium]